MSTVDSDHEELRATTPTTFYDGGLELPGFGTAPDRCREYSPVGFCMEGHTILGRSSCHALYCPDHWNDAVAESVESIVARLGAVRWAADGFEKRLSHVVASPPQDRRYSKRDFWETRSEAYDALKAAGVRGGAMVPHPYRTNDRADDLYETASEHGDVGENQGKWSFLRSISENWEDMTRYIEASPHYHALGLSEDVQPADAPENWLVRRLGTMGSFHYRDVESYEDMVGAAFYVMTHGGYQLGRNIVTYFGEAHPAAFNPEEELPVRVWETIQEKAAAAVRGGSGETVVLIDEEDQRVVGADVNDREECRREGCGGELVDVSELPSMMDDEDWLRRVRSHRDGRERHNRLMGVLLWWEGRCDTPPPSVGSSNSKMLDWLAEKGSAMTAEPQQVSLGSVLQ